MAIGAGPITYREIVAWPAARLVKLPDALTFKQSTFRAWSRIPDIMLRCGNSPGLDSC